MDEQSRDKLPTDQTAQNLLGILEACFELRRGPDQFVGEVVRQALAVLVYIGDVAVIGSQENLGLVEEDDLYGQIRQSKQNGMLGSNPLLNVNEARRLK